MSSLSFEKPHRKKVHGLVSWLWGGQMFPQLWHCGKWWDILSRRLMKEIKDHISCVWSGHVLHKPLCMHWYCKCWNLWHEIVCHGHIMIRVKSVIKKKWTNYAMALYGNANRNFITELSLSLSSIWCGCSIAQNQIVCLLMIPSKWKWALLVSDVFFLLCLQLLPSRSVCS
jgi:hypothetical protein